MSRDRKSMHVVAKRRGEVAPSIKRHQRFNSFVANQLSSLGRSVFLGRDVIHGSGEIFVA